MMMTYLETTLTPDVDDTWVLQINGAVDSGGSDLVVAFESRTISEQLIQAQARKLIIDLAAAERLGLQGLQFIILLGKQLVGHNISIVLENPNPHLKRLLRILQLDAIFDIEL